MAMPLGFLSTCSVAVPPSLAKSPSSSLMFVQPASLRLSHAKLRTSVTFATVSPASVNHRCSPLVVVHCTTAVLHKNPRSTVFLFSFNLKIATSRKPLRKHGEEAERDVSFQNMVKVNCNYAGSANPRLAIGRFENLEQKATKPRSYLKIGAGRWRLFGPCSIGKKWVGSPCSPPNTSEPEKVHLHEPQIRS